MSKTTLELTRSISSLCKTYPAVNSSSSNNLSVTCDQGRKQQGGEGEMIDEHGVDAASLEKEQHNM
jgi:hypothetical protein